MKVSAAAAALASSVGVASASYVSLSPVTRTVELLQGLAKQTEKDGKAEEKLYEKFVCWGTSTVDSKTASNAAAEERIRSLETYVADIEAGRIEFTTERVDLEKDLADINKAIEEATALRKKENEEFLAGEADMVKATSALDGAITVLKEATKNSKDGVLLQRIGSDSISQRLEQSALLAQASELAKKVLQPGDALFLKRVLSGEVPKADWKKLNREATFKMKYKARSFKIQGLLSNLNSTISSNLADARAKEADAVDLHEKLMSAKNGEKDKTEDALTKMEKENGARGLSKQEAKDEVDALREQVTNDERFIEETKASLDKKKKEWKERSELRANELAAMSKAISILHGDDARDLFKKSFKSQGYALLQASSQHRDHETMSARAAAAAMQLRAAAASASRGGGRLAALAALATMGEGSHFKEVLSAIDKMITALGEEEKEDLRKKETCEKDRMDNTRSASLKSRAMDDISDAITRLNAEIEEIKDEVAEKEATVKATQLALTEATEQRGSEHAEFQQSDADDKAASETVLRAKDVLEQFYTSNGMMLVQQPAVAKAGEAPPPPPTTWEAPYGGKTQESTGIIAVLTMIDEDIQKDIATAQAAEDKAQADFDKFKKQSEDQVAALNADVVRLNGERGDKESSVSEQTGDRRNLADELGVVMKTIADAQPGCDYFCIHFESRSKNRQIETDGLRKAKAILSGGEFAAAPDPNREIKPGDAFLVQRSRK
eukprot:TRINITY_DN745_c0_g1_i1.p1 TRINITY_DN745_c0_g1~~TRINITY_DN745_c0_g1_i1.p1  ORF type:complete len:727 (-),score=245.43 TRINITY_DN745_c0_g1_i1:73-2253(-)